MFFHDIFWGGLFFGWAIKMLVIAAVIWFVVHAISRNQADKNIPPYPESALDILKKRYAKGEISKEQYEQMKKDLE